MYEDDSGIISLVIKRFCNTKTWVQNFAVRSVCGNEKFCEQRTSVVL